MTMYDQLATPAEMIPPAWIACRCFGIRAEDCGYFRPEIKRAAKGSIAASAIEQRLFEKLLWWFRHTKSPVAPSRAARLCDDTISTFLSYYRRILPTLRAVERKKADVLIVENVLVPLIAAEFHSTQTDNREFSPASQCWYLNERPFEVAVDHWLCMAGLITASGVVKHRAKPNKESTTGSSVDELEALRKRVERWREKALPKRRLQQLFEDVQATGGRIARYESVAAVSGRLLLAYAIQYSFRLADGVDKRWSNRLRNQFSRCAQNPFICTRGELGVASIQFALRLIKDRFIEEGWRPKQIEVRMSCSYGEDEPVDTEQDNEDFQAEAYNASEEGQFFARLDESARDAGCDPTNWIEFEEFLVSEAANELKRLAGKPASHD